jgi:hypothetical protein
VFLNELATESDDEVLVVASQALEQAADALAAVDPPGGVAHAVAAVPLVRSLDGLPTSAAARREQRAVRAVRLLRKAHTLGFRDAAGLRNYPAIRVLHGRADFEELLALIQQENLSRARR